MDGHLRAQSPATAAPMSVVSPAANSAQRPVRLLDQVRWQIRQLRYSRRTEDALGRLHAQGHISNPLDSARSVVPNAHGKTKAQALQKMFGKQT
jgi:hypothetical protein